MNPKRIAIGASAVVFLISTMYFAHGQQSDQGQKICGAYKQITLTENNSKLISNPNRPFSQVIAFVPTDSTDRTILTSFAFNSGINAIQNVQIGPDVNGSLSGIRIYFEVSDPTGGISAFQVGVKIMQKDATKIGDPQPARLPFPTSE